MFYKKSLFVATALLLPAAAGAQVAGVTANVNAQNVPGAVSGTVQDTVNAATDTAQEVVGKASGNAAVTASAGPTVAATAADVKAGAMVHDPKGGMVGTIESVNATGAVVATGKSRVQLPLGSFAKNDAGLVISLSQSELDAQAAAAAGASAGSR